MTRHHPSPCDSYQAAKAQVGYWTRRLHAAKHNCDADAVCYISGQLGRAHAMVAITKQDVLDGRGCC